MELWNLQRKGLGLGAVELELEQTELQAVELHMKHILTALHVLRLNHVALRVLQLDTNPSENSKHSNKYLQNYKGEAENSTK